MSRFGGGNRQEKKKSVIDKIQAFFERGTSGCRIVSCAKTPDLRTTWRYLATCTLKRFLLTTRYFQPPEKWNRRGMAGRKLYEQFMQNLERADIDGGLRVELQVADYG